MSALLLLYNNKNCEKVLRKLRLYIARCGNNIACMPRLILDMQFLLETKYYVRRRKVKSISTTSCRKQSVLLAFIQGRNSSTLYKQFYFILCCIQDTCTPPQSHTHATKTEGRPSLVIYLKVNYNMSQNMYVNVETFIT